MSLKKGQTFLSNTFYYIFSCLKISNYFQFNVSMNKAYNHTAFIIKGKCWYIYIYLNIVKAVRNIICALDAVNLFENLDKQN